MKTFYTATLLISGLLVSLIVGCGDSHSSEALIQTDEETLYNAPVKNLAAYITSQCYTKTKDDKGVIHNPCFSCHINSKLPNYVDDAVLQGEYPSVTEALNNPWTNLFIDRTAAVEAISNEAMQTYVRTDNYKTASGALSLSQILKENLPASWDSNGDGQWNGYIPDCYFNFDAEGFDRDTDNKHTGWRAFAYYPFLGTFWPTNGSTDDVMIRLSDPFRTDENGTFNLEIYKINLAIVEAMIKREDIDIDAVDETRYGVDLNKDGVLSSAQKVVYDWEPLKAHYMYYVGAAKTAQENDQVHLAAGLYPEGTEFLHSVRYLDIQNNNVTMAARMKELRYGVKRSWYSYSELKQLADREAADKSSSPENYRRISGDFETGFFNSQGWRYQAFIEEKEGTLRPQNNEEMLYCMGCHGGIGATQDSIFSFGRKFDATHLNRGWYHWSQKSFAGEPEPKTPDGRYEYSFYLETNHAGDEFRGNDEVMNKFFDESGELKQNEINLLHEDITHLLIPSPNRAMNLNKAYKVIVDEQSYIYGRDAHVKPVESVHQKIEMGQSTEVADTISYDQ